jgi:hypothetical protein
VAIGYDALRLNQTGNYNAAVGYNALKDNNGGSDNVAVGSYSQEDNTDGNDNVALGFNALRHNNNGDYNVVVGHSALQFPVGSNNTVIGREAGRGVNLSSPTMNGCVLIGYRAGYDLDSDNKLYIENSESESPLIYGDFDTDILSVNGKLGVGTMSPTAQLEVAGHIAVSNTGNSVFIGKDAGLNDDLSENGNTYIGDGSGRDNILGEWNTAVGKGAMGIGDKYTSSTAIGHGALYRSTESTGNIAIGYASMMNVTTGGFNSAIGFMAMYGNETGTSNCAMGRRAMEYNTTGSSNVAIGNLSMQNNLVGNYNTVIGMQAGQGSYNESISGSIFVGYRAGQNENTDNKLYIENSESSTPLIYGEFDNDIVAINGKLGIGTHSPAVPAHITGGVDATLTSGGYLITGLTTGQNIVMDENEIMARNNGVANSLHLQRDGGPLSIHYDVGEISEFRINSDGWVGIGENQPAAKLHINTNPAEPAMRAQISGGTKLFIASNGGIANHYETSPAYAIQLVNSSTNTLTGSAVAWDWAQYSDERLKSQQEELDYGLDEVLQLSPKSYMHHSSEINEDGSKILVGSQKAPTIGFIAQELQQVIPEAVNEPENESTELWAISYTKLIPVLTKAIQEQQEMMESMQQEIDQLKQQLQQQE